MKKLLFWFDLLCSYHRQSSKERSIVEGNLVEDPQDASIHLRSYRRYRLAMVPWIHHARTRFDDASLLGQSNIDSFPSTRQWLQWSWNRRHLAGLERSRFFWSHVYSVVGASQHLLRSHPDAMGDYTNLLFSELVGRAGQSLCACCYTYRNLVAHSSHLIKLPF